MEKETGLRVFGLRTFARRGTEFVPVTAGPIPPGYVVGPGDEVVLILTGDVEEDMVLPVTRDGFILIPEAGKVWVNGLTLEELRDRLYRTLGRVYSGLGRGPEASIQLEVSLGRLRTNQVFVTGEVVNPGAYTTSALGSVLNALYLAGGPLPTGSFRDVRVLRNNELVQRVDLYDYLTRGFNMSDVTLNPGDVIFIPPAGQQVAVRGAVTREGLYEVRPDEAFLDALQFAGGLAAPAALGRARITRILPPGQRSEPGLDRTVVDVDLAAVIRGDTPPPPLYDGDELRIFRVRPEVRKIVTVSGAIWKNCVLPQNAGGQQPPPAGEEYPGWPQPQSDPTSPEGQYPAWPPVTGDGIPPGMAVLPTGDTVSLDSIAHERQAREREAGEKAAVCTFHYRPGMRAWDLIAAADGLRPEAYRQRAQILRVDPADSTLSIVPFTLELNPDGTPLENPALEEFDALRVFSRAGFQDSLKVRISGEVRHPGEGMFEYREGMTLEDLLLEAGGLTPEADLVIEVSRRPELQERRAGRLAHTIRVPVDESYIMTEEGIRYYPGDPAQIEDNGDDRSHFELRPHDHVFVRRVPNLSEGDRTVTISGEVAYPGAYTLQSKDERLSDLLERTGGLTNTAFAGGFRLYRDGELVNTDLPSVLESPGSPPDLILLPGDSMVLPEYDPVVLVQGAVNSPAQVLYREGAGLDYYIENAGGYARSADRGNVHVRYANGEGAVRERVLLFRRSPTPGPGSVVSVPEVPEDERGDFLRSVAEITAVTASVLQTLLILTRL
jgi:protein involved in polysaccharide export with SLBB domain